MHFFCRVEWFCRATAALWTPKHAGVLTMLRNSRVSCLSVQARLIVVLTAGVLFFLLALPAFAAAATAGIPAPRDIPYPGTISLTVDVSNVSQSIFQVQEKIPVQAGKLILLYPKWIPGSHSASGPLPGLAGLVITANGERLMWERYGYDVYAFRVTVPQGVSDLDLSFQFLPGRGRSGFIQATDKMLSLDWNAVSLYPAGYYARDITFMPSVTLPSDWKFATALRAGSQVREQSTYTVAFKPTTYNTLVDSPVYAGMHLKRLDLDPDAKVPVHLDLFADDASALQVTPEQLQDLRNLVTQAYRLFDSRHYDHYDFLFQLFGHWSGNGDEHHQSSEDGASVDFFTNWANNAPNRDLLAHEYVHSWNGKFRRPADLWTPNFNVPMQDSLLWVYEGLTQYWGMLLTARSGMWTPSQYRGELAMVAANFERNRPGLQWRTLEDTTDNPIIGDLGMPPYRSWQLSGNPYYRASVLMWLAVDVKIRELTKGKRSLDTFARDFFGIDNGSVVTKTYTFQDIVTALNKVAGYDWAGFLHRYLNAWNPPLLSGVAASGWELVFTDKESDYEEEYDTQPECPCHLYNFTYSIGLTLTDDGKINDVLWDGPAFNAGIGSGGTVVAVDGRAYTAEGLKRAITAATDGKTPISLVIDYLGEHRTVSVAYHGGLRYPHLVRIRDARDYLDEIIAPKS